MARFLVFSDIHLHPFPAFSRLDGGINSRLNEIGNVLSNILEIADNRKCDAVLFSGDFYHTRKLDIETIEVGSRALWSGSKHIPIIAISGNHDQADKLGEFSSISALKGRLRILHSGEIDNVAGVTIKGIPFQGNKRNILEYLKAEDADIVLMHTGIGNAMMGSELVASDHEFIGDGEMMGRAQYIFSGHFHQPQLFSDDKVYLPEESTQYALDDMPAIIIPGAPVQHGFGDEGSVRGCWLLDTSKNHLEFIPLDGPNFIRVSLDEIDKLDKTKKYYGTITVPKGTKEGAIKKAEKMMDGQFVSYNLIREPDIAPSQVRADIKMSDPMKEIIKTYVNHTTKPIPGKPNWILEELGNKLMKEAKS